MAAIAVTAYWVHTLRASACNDRGVAWCAKNEYDRAIVDFNEAIRLDPKFSPAYMNRGNAWLAKKEHDTAIADYNEAVRLEPKHATALANRGRAWRAKKKYDIALADYNEAIRLNPKQVGAYNNRAWLWATCPDPKYRDGKRAVESATRACELSERKIAHCIGSLAAAHAEAGDFDAAVKLQMEANARYDDTEDRERGEERLKLYEAKKPYRDIEP
jgi:Tfp pilus assembly protein PilF